MTCDGTVVAVGRCSMAAVACIALIAGCGSVSNGVERASTTRAVIGSTTTTAAPTPVDERPCVELTARAHLGPVRAYLRTTRGALLAHGLGAPTKAWVLGQPVPAWVHGPAASIVTACYFGVTPSIFCMRDGAPPSGQASTSSTGLTVRWVTDSGASYPAAAESGAGEVVYLPDCPRDAANLTTKSPPPAIKRNLCTLVPADAVQRAFDIHRVVKHGSDDGRCLIDDGTANLRGLVAVSAYPSSAWDAYSTFPGWTTTVVDGSTIGAVSSSAHSISVTRFVVVRDEHYAVQLGLPFGMGNRATVIAASRIALHVLHALD